MIPVLPKDPCCFIAKTGVYGSHVHSHSHQSSIINHQSSITITIIINHQSSIINHQSSIINHRHRHHQSSIINHQSSSSSSPSPASHLSFPATLSLKSQASWGEPCHLVPTKGERWEYIYICAYIYIHIYIVCVSISIHIYIITPKG